MKIKRLRLHFTGVVQGVGFRPHVYRLATKLRLSGFVCNRPDGVRVEIEGLEIDVDQFTKQLLSTLPAPAIVNNSTRQELLFKEIPDGRPETSNPFEIRESPQEGSQELTIGADMATCPACLNEMNDPADRRFGYPFINCTDCGPRLTIVKDLPYDRQRTSMAPFPLCRKCQDEYDDPQSRRFHAEATACPECGPQLTLCDTQGEKIAATNILHATGKLLKEGKIVALKGLGGFHLAVAAANHEAVNRLRKRKQRDGKPFALMVKDLAAAEKLAYLNETEKELLLTPSRPILLLEKKDENSHQLSSAIAPGLAHYGIMLPYTPLHHLLFAEGITALVMTSANLHDEPICIDNREALQRLKKIADFFLLHNRDIVIRLDDSVVMVVNQQMQLLRRSRGYVPQSLSLDDNSPDPFPAILALGGQLKNSLCLLKDKKALSSPHIGDLETPQARDFFHENIGLMEKISACQPEIIACDLHPAYYSSTAAKKLSAKTIIRVQHHHAHIVSCMADNQISGPVLGLAMDGTGYGTDGHIWGGEFLHVEENSFTRLGQLTYFRLPGGERAIREPWRIGLSLLQQADPDDWLKKARDLKFFPDSFSDQDLSLILKQSVNNPLTSSLGRFFDGVAAILGFSQATIYEGQAAIELEAMATKFRRIHQNHKTSTTALLPWTITEELRAKDERYYQLNLLPMIKKLAELSLSGHSREALAALYHDSLTSSLMTTAERLAKRHNLERIVLSGGCFQNRLLIEGCQQWPGNKCNSDNNKNQTMTIYCHRQVPTNDGGLALGQALIAAQQMAK
ncbi:MAG: carbamoyltransferase HypF [Pseudomonadota bacterium]|nr:carbamoyltransferase HypF [Pseudomonadota bacterium]